MREWRANDDLVERGGGLKMRKFRVFSRDTGLISFDVNADDFHINEHGDAVFLMDQFSYRIGLSKSHVIFTRCKNQRNFYHGARQ